MEWLVKSDGAHPVRNKKWCSLDEVYSITPPQFRYAIGVNQQGVPVVLDLYATALTADGKFIPRWITRYVDVDQAIAALTILVD